MKFRFLVVGYMSVLWAGKILPKSTLKLLYLVKPCTKNEVHDWKYLFLNWLNNLHLSHSTVIKMATLFQLLMLIPKKLLTIVLKIFFLFNPLLWIFFSLCSFALLFEKMSDIRKFKNLFFTVIFIWSTSIFFKLKKHWQISLLSCFMF